MASTLIRRPLPALVSLVALLLLTGIVWWRVLHRDDGSADAPGGCPTPSPSATQVALPARPSIIVQVLNSTKRNGLATNVRKTLIADGFDVPAKASDDTSKKKNTATAQIRFGPKGKQAATHVGYYFPGAVLVTTTSANSTVVVALGEKFKKVATASAVAAAMKADHVAVASPAPTPGPASGSASC